MFLRLAVSHPSGSCCCCCWTSVLQLLIWWLALFIRRNKNFRWATIKNFRFVVFLLIITLISYLQLFCWLSSVDLWMTYFHFKPAFMFRQLFKLFPPFFVKKIQNNGLKFAAKTNIKLRNSRHPSDLFHQTFLPCHFFALAFLWMANFVIILFGDFSHWIIGEMIMVILCQILCSDVFKFDVIDPLSFSGHSRLPRSQGWKRLSSRLPLHK